MPSNAIVSYSATMCRPDTCAVAIRPEAIVLEAAAAGRNQMKGTIDEVHFLGSVVRIRVRFGANAIKLDPFNNPALPPPARGSDVTVSFSREDVLVLDGAEAA